MIRLKQTMLGVFFCAVLPLVLAITPVLAKPESHALAIDNAYQDWEDATNAKDIEKWVSFLAPGAIFLPPNSPALNTQESIKAFYTKLFLDKRFLLDCHQEKVEVSNAGDFAWSTGQCDATFTGENGEEAHDKSKWAKVWKRQPNGEWKCTMNSWSSTFAR